MRDRTHVVPTRFLRHAESMKLFLNHLFSFYNFDALSDLAKVFGWKRAIFTILWKENVAECFLLSNFYVRSRFVFRGPTSACVLWKLGRTNPACQSILVGFRCIEFVVAKMLLLKEIILYVKSNESVQYLCFLFYVYLCYPNTY